jgi:transcriptional regulator with XRE-family HTH domain
MSYTNQEKVYLRKIGENVRSTREKIGWSQEVLGFESSVHRTYIGAIERGERNISLLSLRKIAKALDTTLTSLVDIEEHEKK